MTVIVYIVCSSVHYRVSFVMCDSICSQKQNCVHKTCFTFTKDKNILTVQINLIAETHLHSVWSSHWHRNTGFIWKRAMKLKRLLRTRWAVWSSPSVWWYVYKPHNNQPVRILCPSSPHRPETSGRTVPDTPADLQSHPDRETHECVTVWHLTDITTDPKPHWCWPDTRLSLRGDNRHKSFWEWSRNHRNARRHLHWPIERLLSAGHHSQPLTQRERIYFNCLYFILYFIFYYILLSLILISL